MHQYLFSLYIIKRDKGGKTDREIYAGQICCLFYASDCRLYRLHAFETFIYITQSEREKQREVRITEESGFYLCVSFRLEAWLYSLHTE